MPKQKSHRGLRKRVKVSKNGKVKRHSGFAGHLMSSKSPQRRRRLRRGKLVSPADTKAIISRLSV